MPQEPWTEEDYQRINKLRETAFKKGPMNNPPAFPLAIPGDCQVQPEYGMDLRDYFAAKAMQVLQQQYMTHVINGKVEPESADGMIASDAYEIADAMLAEREKGAK